MLKSKRILVSAALMGSLAVGPLTGCENLPGNDKQQGTVIGGATGAAIGAAVAKDNRLLGALIGGALGAGGGYLIGANKDKITGDDREESREEAIRASEQAQRDPARVDDVSRSSTADLNNDGFVTLDEVVALDRAGLDDREMVDRLERTNQVFELTPWQEDYLQDQGVSRDVILRMRNLNQDLLAQPVSDRFERSDEVNRDTRFDNDQYDRIDRVDDRGDRFDQRRSDGDRFDNSGSLERFD